MECVAAHRAGEFERSGGIWLKWWLKQSVAARKTDRVLVLFKSTVVAECKVLAVTKKKS